MHIPPRALQIILGKNWIWDGRETPSPPYADLPFMFSAVVDNQCDSRELALVSPSLELMAGDVCN